MSKEIENSSKETPETESNKALLKSLERLNASISKLDDTLNVFREYEFMEIHRSKWKIFAHQLLLWVLFAIGTVMGLVLLSWSTYTFFKDSAVLRNTIDSQLKMRQFDFEWIMKQAKTDAVPIKIVEENGSWTETKNNTGSTKK